METQTRQGHDSPRIQVKEVVKSYALPSDSLPVLFIYLLFKSSLAYVKKLESLRAR